jgi:hypothetical protein
MCARHVLHYGRNARKHERHRAFERAFVLALALVIRVVARDPRLARLEQVHRAQLREERRVRVEGWRGRRELAERRKPVCRRLRGADPERVRSQLVPVPVEPRRVGGCARDGGDNGERGVRSWSFVSICLDKKM